MRNGKHISTEELAQFQDGDLRGDRLMHLESCPECSSRLDDLGNAASVFQEYLSVTRRLQPPPPRPWQNLSAIVSEHSSSKPGFPARWVWIAAAASLAAVFLFADWKRNAASVRTQDLLSESARTARRPEGRISITVGGATILRPALLETEVDDDPSLKRLHRAFDHANYNWRDPLSARSFLAWRNTLKTKRDRVNVIGEGSHRAYRVRTENPAGPLKAASLTLQGSEMQPIAGSFEFIQDGTVEMSIAGKAAEGVTQNDLRKAADPARETQANAEDTLRVLAALHRIGADVEDPIVVSEDAKRGIVVRGHGLSTERQKAIVESLRGIPHATVDFSTAESPDRPSTQRAGEPYATNLPPGIRRKLEERVGGAVALQILTDELLDASASLIARTHAIETLREKFPLSVEANLSPEGRRMLDGMHRDHAMQIRREIEAIHAKVTPLLTQKEALPPAVPAPAAHSFGAAVRHLDASLNRLLAGTYNEAEGESLLEEVQAQLGIVSAIVQAQEEFRL